MGYFLNPLPLRANLSGNPTFQALLQQMRSVLLEAISNDDVNTDHIADELQTKPDPSRHPLFTVAFSVAPDLPQLAPGWGMTYMDVESGAARWDLYIEMSGRADGMIGRAQYNPDLFTSAEIALTVALVSAGLQSIPKRGGAFQPVKMLFNATMVVASAIGSMLLHSSHLTAMQGSGVVAVVAGCGVFFLMNTVPVATIIAITEGTRVLHIWSDIAHLSFPFYVLSMGLTFMVTVVSQHPGWQQPLAVLPAMLLMYRSYRRYFQEDVTVEAPTAGGGLTRAASAR